MGGTGGVAPLWPAHAVNDVALLFCESAGGQPVTLTTANGFAAVTNSPQATGAGTAGTQITVFWARATSAAMTAPVVADAGDHVYCQILTYRGVIISGNPWDVTGGGVKATASTSVTVTGVTTTVANTLVVQAVAHDLDNAGAQFSAQSNGNFTATERVDAGTTQGNGGGFSVWDGVMASAGATGNTSATVTNSINAFFTIALVPAPPTPTLQGVGTGVGNNGTVSPAWPAHETNDIGLLFCESANQTITLTTANGFATVASSPQGTGTAGAAGATRLHVFWARATSAAMAAPLVADPGNHVYCQILTYRGVITSGDPWDATSGGTKDTASTSVSITGVTTTTGNTLVVQAVAHDLDSAAAQFSGVANGTLSALSERADAGTNQGNGGGILILDGVMSSAGATGTTTATVTSSVNAFTTIALLPATPRLSVPTGTLAGDVMIASIVVTPSSTQILPPSGWTAQTAIVQGSGGGARQQIFWRVADAGDAAGGVTYQWSLDNASTGLAGAILSYSSVDTISASPINVIGGNSTASGTAHTANAVTTTVPNTMLISTHSFASSESWTPPTAPSGMTERVDINSQGVSSAVGISLEMNDVIQTSAGTTGSITANAAGNADTGTAQIVALRPAYTHYSVSYPNGTSYATCEPAVVRIEAHHAGDGLAAPPAGTVMNIATSNGTGVWQSPPITGTAAAWSPSGSNDGQATYTWQGNEAVLEVRLRHNAATTLNLNITETPAGKTEGTGTEDPTLTFATTVLRVTDASATGSVNIATQVAAKASDSNGLGTGTPAYYVQGVATATNNTCQTLFRNQNVSIDFAMQCNSPTNCATTLDTFDVKNSGGTFTSITKSSAAPGTYTAVSLSFDNTADAKAPLVFRYNDAGQATLHMRYTLPSPPASSTITGTSNAFVTRPFGLAFRGASSGTTVTHGVDHTSTVLAAAGDTFTMTVVAYKWASAEDDGTGNPLAAADITDNGITPSFTGAVTVAPAASGNLPGIALGAMQRGSGCNNAATIAATEFLSAGVPTGVATVTDWCYTEAGNVLLTATTTDYITTGITVSGNSGLDDTSGSNGHVGRFRPKQFAITGTSTITHRSAQLPVCSPASAFTYMSENLALGFTLEAQNTQGTKTQNYSGSYAKFNIGSGNLNLGALDGATNFSTASRVQSPTSSGSWSNGAATITSRTQILRATSPDGPYTAVNWGIAPNDGEGVVMSSFDMNIGGSNDHKNIGVTGAVRFGRLRQQNAVASSGVVVLPVPIETQYWTGSVFTLNTDDKCTTIPTTIVGIDLTGLTGGTTSPSSTTFANGAGFIRLAAPGNAAKGYVLVTPNLTTADQPIAGTPARTYLQGNWTGSTWDKNPSNRAAWGVFGSAPQNFIYQRENY